MPSPRTRYMRPENFHPRQLPVVLETLAGALQRPVRARHTQSIELAEHLRNVVAPLAAACRGRATTPAFSAWPESAADALGSGLAALGGTLAEGEVIFYLSFTWGFLGPVRLDARRDLAYAVDVARSWAQECAVCSADGREGFWLEYEPVYGAHAEPYPFELVVWGEAWPDIARAVLPFELAAREA